MTTLRSPAEVVAVIRDCADPGHRLIVGIAGAPGAGKSTIAAELVDALGSDAALLPMDGYHLTQAALEGLGRRERMGAPDTFDVAGLLGILADLRTPGLPVLAPGFDREIEEPRPRTIHIDPAIRTVIVEGNYLLLEADGWGEVAGFLDLSFFVDIDDALRLERLIARHERFGKSPAQAREWALGPDEANARIIGATAPRADYRISLG